jgi:hypothetical protein
MSLPEMFDGRSLRRKVRICGELIYNEEFKRQPNNLQQLRGHSEEVTSNSRPASRNPESREPRPNTRLLPPRELQL